MSNKVWITSDLHLSHKKVSELRGFKTLEEHDNTIIHNIWDTVRAGDSLWILGDLLFNRGTRLDTLRALLFHLISDGVNVRTVLGNHDVWSARQLTELGFNKVFGAAYGKHGTLLTHIPVHPGQKDRFTLNIHGHLHDKVLDDPWYFNVCLEQNGLKPFNMEEVYEKIPSPSTVALAEHVSELTTGLGLAGTPAGSEETGAGVPITYRAAFGDLRDGIALDYPDA